TGNPSAEDGAPDATPRGLNATQRDLLALIKRRGTLRTVQLNAALSGQNWRGAVDAMAAAGIVQKTPILAPPRARARFVQTAALAIPPSEINARIAAVERPSRPADLLAVVANGTTDKKAALKAASANATHLEKLIDAGYVTADDTQIALAIPPANVADTLNLLRKLDKPLQILRLLAREMSANDGQPLDVSWVYAQADAELSDLKRLEAGGLITLSERQQWRDSLKDTPIQPSAPPPLTSEQEQAWNAIRAAILARSSAAQAHPLPEFDLPADVTADTPPLTDAAAWTFLLHGVTGSGKTEIYLRAIELTLGLGRQALFLVPEIALTPQTVARVAGRFPGRTVVIHSRISEGERYDAWARARDGLASVVVGARSALFTPFPDAGLIILDEEHDSSYKQSPSFHQPYYHARRVAEMLTRQRDAVLILGSATPDIETTYRAARGEITRLELPHRIAFRASSSASAHGAPTDAHGDLPPVQIVDMRAELRGGNSSIFSGALREGVRAALERGEQSILFLNRRGQSTYVFCRECGYVAACPRCDAPLTHHREGVLRCHRCGYSQPEPVQCPICHSRKIKYFGAGTQQIESALQAAFPGVRVLRWDADSAAGAGAHEQIMERFIAHEADVIVGTQMISKGIDIPLVTFVGIVSADVGLTLPDFRANERAFQLLMQVAGRAGRGWRGGSVVLQTYQPENYAIIAAASHDYARFYERELAFRKEMGYPPFRRLARLIIRYTDAQKTQAEAERAAVLLRQRIAHLHLTATTVIGAAPCFFGKENNYYRWHVLLRGPDPTLALRELELPAGWVIDIDPTEIL
ncbi:MAG: primosomal protein N', partial [Chloroflexota bacterium]|nr:primosomal protein N' [Chloroflexota bacterium]